MHRRDRAWVLITVVLTCSFVGVPAAHAYIDPGAGSFVFQALVGGLLAAALALKVFWRRIVGSVTGRGRPEAEPSSEPSAIGRDD